MDRTFKGLSFSLSCPTRALQHAVPEIGGVLASDTRLTAAARRALRPLMEALSGGDIYDLQERYVGLFDRSRTLSLNLIEHVYGESRDRGGAMVSLVEMYRDAGFDPVTSELPDHLPMLLEILATRPLHEAQGALGGRGSYSGGPEHVTSPSGEPLWRRLRRALAAVGRAGRPGRSGRPAGRAGRGSERPRRTRQGLGGDRSPLWSRSRRGMPTGARHARAHGRAHQSHPATRR